MSSQYTSVVYQYLGIDDGEYDVSFIGGDYVVTRYESATPRPNDATVIATAASQPFLDWEAENGGDPTLTARRIVKEALDEPSGKVLVALVKVLIEFGVIPGTLNQVRNQVMAKIAAGEVD